MRVGRSNTQDNKVGDLHAPSQLAYIYIPEGNERGAGEWYTLIASFKVLMQRRP